MSVEIHSTAMVDPKAQLGKDVVIGPYCIVEGDGVELGDGTRLDAFAQVKNHTTLGPGNHLHSYACLGGAPQHLGYQGEDTKLEVGSGNIFREHVTVHRGTPGGRGATRMGNDCMLMAYVHVAHDCVLENKVIMANAASLAGHVTVGSNAIINGMSGVHQWVRIGEYAFLGAMGGFTQDVPPYTLATGVRAKLHGLNLIGLKRSGFSGETISALKKAYKAIWCTDMVRADALNEAEAELGSHPEVLKLTAFIRASQRGVTPHAGRNGNGDSNGDCER